MGLNRLIPGVHSASAYHDADMTNKKAPDYMLPVTIPQYFYYNYYGALGTMLRNDVTAGGQPKPIQPLDK